MTASRAPFLLTLAAALLGAIPAAAALLPLQDAAAEEVARADEPSAPQPVVGETDSIWAYLVQKYDTDGDGRIVLAEYTRDKQTFARLDRNRDGVVTAEEVERERTRGGPPSSMMATMVVLRAFGGGEGGFPSGVTREQLENGAAAMDTDADLAISRAEFEKSMGRRAGGGRRGGGGGGGGGGPMGGMDRYAMLIDGVDTDEDEMLSREELLAWFDAADSDKDGQLTVERPSIGRGGARGDAGGGPGGGPSGDVPTDDAPSHAGADTGADTGADAGVERGGGPGGGGPGGRGREPAGVPEPAAGIGRTAPDFTLQPMNAGEPITLSSFADKTPVALIFGSYT